MRSSSPTDKLPGIDTLRLLSDARVGCPQAELPPFDRFYRISEVCATCSPTLCLLVKAYKPHLAPLLGTPGGGVLVNGDAASASPPGANADEDHGSTKHAAKPSAPSSSSSSLSSSAAPGDGGGGSGDSAPAASRPSTVMGLTVMGHVDRGAQEWDAPHFVAEASVLAGAGGSVSTSLGYYMPSYGTSVGAARAVAAAAAVTGAGTGDGLGAGAEGARAGAVNPGSLETGATIIPGEAAQGNGMVFVVQSGCLVKRKR